MSSNMIQAANGVVLARAVQAVLKGEQLGTAEHQHAGVLLLAGGAHIPTGRPFTEVAAEVEAANDLEQYVRQGMDHLLAGVQVRELRLPDDDRDDGTGLFPLPAPGDVAATKES